MKNFIIVNTKGGVGKSTIALNILPALLYKNSDDKIYYYQLDNNNKLNIKSKFIDIKEFKLNNLTDVLTSIEFSDNDINIIDCGGGDDTKIILKELENSILENLIFIVPVSKNLSIRHNIFDTVKLINEKFTNPKIYLFLNYINSIDNIHNEFINIFGNELYDIAPVNLSKYNIKNIFGYIPETNLFSIFEFKKEILLDAFLNSKSISENDKIMLKNKKEKIYERVNNNEITKEEGLLEYQNFNKQVRQAKEVKKLITELKEINENFLSDI